ncbi:MAG: ATP-grasp domain-containing protein, partial [Acidobacteria bacterium]|nr:ATP-grasp domain-containing protein [Acidobacteriota bacterium]
GARFEVCLGGGGRRAVAAAAIAADLGLRGTPPQAARAASNKLSTRRCFEAHGLPGPWFRVLAPGQPAAAGQAADMTFPCVVKPLSMAASQGVVRADTRAALAAAVERVRRLGARADPPLEVLVEGYIPGREVALEGILTAGRLRVLAIFDKPEPLEGPFFEETIYVAPGGGADTPSIADAVQRAVTALGLTDGPIHAECRINAEGMFVLEVAARPIGGLCSRVLRFDGPPARGISLEELLLRHALGGDAAEWRREARAAGVMMIPIPSAGRLERVDGLDAARAVGGVEEVVITARRGQTIQPPPDGGSYLGFILARAARPPAVTAALRAAHGRLRIRIQPVIPVV